MTHPMQITKSILTANVERHFTIVIVVDDGVGLLVLIMMMCFLSTTTTTTTTIRLILVTVFGILLMVGQDSKQDSTSLSQETGSREQVNKD
jgi:hypothetical protein